MGGFVIKHIIRRFVTFFADASKKETAIGSFLQFLKHSIASPIFQAIVNAAAGVLFVVLPMVANIKIWHIIGVGILYLVIQVVFARNNAHCKHVKERMDIHHATTQNIGQVAYLSGFDYLKKLKTSMFDMYVSTKHIRETVGFQIYAMLVCSGIYNTIKEGYGCSDHYVSVYQVLRGRVLDKYHDVVKMIGYGWGEKIHPRNYTYREDNDYYCVKLFSTFCSC